MIFLLIAAFIILILIEVPKLVREKSWRELAAYSVLMSIAFVVSLLYTLHIEIPNPVRDTQYLVKSLLHLSYD
jgi:hypothetical protein